MKTKIFISILFTIVILAYLIGLIGNTFLFVVLLPIASLVLLFTMSMTLEELIFRFFSRKKIYHRGKLRFIILNCFLFSFFIGWLIYHVNVTENIKLRYIQIDLIIFLFIISITWCIFNSVKKIRIYIAIISIISIVSLILIIGLKSYSPTEQISIEALKSLPYLTWVPIEKNFQSD